MNTTETYGQPWKQQYNINTHQNNSFVSYFNRDDKYFPFDICRPSLAVTNNKIILIGGLLQDKPSNTVFICNLNEYNNIESFSTGCSLPENIVDCELLVRNNFLYTIGGINEHGPITNIYRAPIDVNGNIGLWTKVSELPTPIKHVKTFIFKNRIYVFGSQLKEFSFQRHYHATIDKDGSIGEWTIDKIPNNEHVDHINFREGELALVGNYVYLIGCKEDGRRKYDIVKGTLDDNANFVNWEFLPGIPFEVTRPNAVVLNNRLYIFCHTDIENSEGIKERNNCLISCIIYEDGYLGNMHYEHNYIPSLGDNLNVCLLKDKLYVFGYTGMCSYKDQDRVICELRLKSDYSDYSKFYA